MRRFATALGNDYGGATDNAPRGTLTAASIPYNYSVLHVTLVAQQVPREAGAILIFNAPATNQTTIPLTRRYKAAGLAL